MTLWGEPERQHVQDVEQLLHTASTGNHWA